MKKALLFNSTLTLAVLSCLLSGPVLAKGKKVHHPLTPAQVAAAKAAASKAAAGKNVAGKISPKTAARSSRFTRVSRNTTPVHTVWSAGSSSAAAPTTPSTVSRTQAATTDVWGNSAAQSSSAQTSSTGTGHAFGWVQSSSTAAPTGSGSLQPGSSAGLQGASSSGAVGPSSVITRGASSAGVQTGSSIAPTGVSSAGVVAPSSAGIVGISSAGLTGPSASGLAGISSGGASAMNPANVNLTPTVQNYSTNGARYHSYGGSSSYQVQGVVRAINAPWMTLGTSGGQSYQVQYTVTQAYQVGDRLRASLTPSVNGGYTMTRVVRLKNTL